MWAPTAPPPLCMPSAAVGSVPRRILPQEILISSQPCAGRPARPSTRHETSIREGRNRKFVETVQQVTYSGEYGASIGQEVLYVTERCVFRLGENGLELCEAAPGIDPQRQILDLMEGPVTVAKDFKPMPMGL